MSKRNNTRFKINRFRPPQAPPSATRPANANPPAAPIPGPANKILFNAIQKGLTAQTILLPGENAELLRTLAGSFIAIYQPANDAEFLIVEEMVAAKWRLRRSWGAESCLIQSESAIQSAKIANDFEAPKPDHIQTLALRELADNSKALAYLNRQQVRFAREYDRALAQLRIHQTLRMEQEASSTVESQHTHESPGLPPTPIHNEIRHQSPEKANFQNNPNAPENYPHQQASEEQGLPSSHLASTPGDPAGNEK